MIDMRSERVKITDSSCTIEGAAQLLSEFFTTPKAFVLSESTEAAKLGRVTDFSTEFLLNAETISLRIFDKNRELLLEKSPGETTFFYRLLEQDSAGEELYFLDYPSLLRKTSATSPPFGSGESQLIYREYYKCDDDGLALPAGIRLLEIKEG